MTGRKRMTRSAALLLALSLLFASCGSETEAPLPPDTETEQAAGTEPEQQTEPAEDPAETDAAPETEAVREEENTVENEDWRRIYEAEDAKLTSNSVLTSGANGTSGKGYVGKFESSDSAAEFTVTVPGEGLYTLYIAAIGIWGEKVAKLSV